MRINKPKYYPEKIFISYATEDSMIANIIKKELEKISFIVFLAEKEIIGSPLIEKLKSEIISSNAIFVIWTKNSSKIKRTSNIISFEVGMAYSLRLPIFLLRFNNAKVPWFFDKVTDYENVRTYCENDIISSLKKINFSKFFHPIDVIFPKEKWTKYKGKINAYRNVDVIDIRGCLRFPQNFKGTLFYDIINNTMKPTKDVRIKMRFPEFFKLEWNPGILNTNSTKKEITKIIRTEYYFPIPSANNVIYLFFPSLSTDNLRMEVNIEILNINEIRQGNIDIEITSENTIWHNMKSFPFSIN